MGIAPQLHGNRRTFSASHAVEKQAETLLRIKAEDDLSYEDLGRYLGGKSDDRARAYAPKPESEQPISAIDMLTFLAACETFKGRFADPLLALVGGRWADADLVCSGDACALALAMLLPKVIEFEADGTTDVDELRPNEALIRKVHALTGGWLQMLATEDHP